MIKGSLKKIKHSVYKEKSNKAKNAVEKKQASSPPKYFDMIKTAIRALNDKKGTSCQRITKYIIAKNKKLEKSDPKRVRVSVVTALKKGLSSGTFKNARRPGVPGYFKLTEV